MSMLTMQSAYHEQTEVGFMTVCCSPPFAKHRTSKIGDCLKNFLFFKIWFAAFLFFEKLLADLKKPYMTWKVEKLPETYF